MPEQDRRNPILLVVDLQQGLVQGTGEMSKRSTPDLVENVMYLLKIWRERSWPIVHVHNDDIDDPSNPISSHHPETFAPHSCAQPQGDERVFVKHKSSAFVGTELATALNSYGKTIIVVIGMDGSQCINSTTRHGADLGYNLVVVADACASLQGEDWRNPENTIDPQVWHDFAMSMLGGNARVTRTKELLGVLGAEVVNKS